MPARQHGSVDKRRLSWRARWRDENGKAHEKSGFATELEARDFVRIKVEQVQRKRDLRRIYVDAGAQRPENRREGQPATVGRLALRAEGQDDRSEPLLAGWEVAQLLGVSLSWVAARWQAFDRGDADGLPGYRLGRPPAPVRFDWSQIEIWLERRHAERHRLTTAQGPPHKSVRQ